MVVCDSIVATGQHIPSSYERNHGLRRLRHRSVWRKSAASAFVAVATLANSSAVAIAQADADDIDKVGIALESCNRELEACRENTGVVRSSQLTPGDPRAPPWPKNYGQLLRFPFGVSDMKQLKEIARNLWSPDGTAATIPEKVTGHGFIPMTGMRCTSEVVGKHPVGGQGVRWSADLWSEAQEWCLQQEDCTGIMLYVGSNQMNCHHWCSRPQFCNGAISEDSGVEASADWNLWVRGPKPP
eukprot:TRINITY_DN32306_c0_g1_i1.p1 TRINITY_DN32306_c0_g1~~TRINITY_DN32306_c0_g1_i1.p1  ORF type:complete len:242 (+),score=34.67 TRINITY_DN32306_c0_g1_i1:78-803(+)